MLEGQPDPPLYFARMKRENREGVPLLASLPSPRQIPAAELLTSAEAEAPAIVDMRPWEAFRSGHIPGSLWAPLKATFPGIVGSYLKEDQAIALLCEPDEVDRAVRACVRIGLDRVVVWAPAEKMGDLASGGTLESIREITPAQVDDLRAQGVPVLDVRSAAEHAAGAIPGAINIAHTRLTERLDEAPRAEGGEVIVHCRTGVRSAHASALLASRGFVPLNLAGGYERWREESAAART
jgi:hydroxyacylglutathione hydrolase